MDEPLEELYFRWLYSQVGSVKTRLKSKTYWGLLRQLHTKEFVWFIPNDDNRVMDGLQLRADFCAESGIEAVDEGWAAIGCSFLEMVIALTRRLSFEAEGEPLMWFWKLMRNLELTVWTDDQKIPVEEISEKLDRVIWRTYEPNGRGGLFPIKNPDRDQTQVELWYQLNGYLMDNDYA